MTLPTASRAAGGSDLARPEPPFNIALVEEMLRLLSRAVRAHQLYLHNNPTYLRALDLLRNAFVPIWTHTDTLLFDVSDTQISWGGHVVVNEPDKTGDALPWVLYKDGIRGLTLLKGVEAQEIVTLVQILAKVRKAAPDEDDLLTLLWEHEFAGIRYRYIDAGIESAAAIDREEPTDPPRLVDSVALQEPPRENLLPPGVISMDDFDSTLYFLDDSEIEYLRGEIQTHYASDLRGNVVSVLLDVFEQQTDPAVRDEICGILDGLLVQLLAGSHLRTVAVLLREVNVAANRARDLTPAQRELLLSLPNRMSEPEAVSQLLQSLDERADLPPQDELNELFEQLRVGALGTIFGWLGRINSAAVRKLLEAAAERLASANTAELVRLIGAPEREIALEAVRRSGAAKAQAAVPALARLLTQGDPGMRLAAVQSLAGIATPGAMPHLERALDDADREVRVAAAKALGARQYRASLAKLEAAITGRRMPQADLTEKMAFFEAYGVLCGEPGIQLLDGILNRRGLFGQREDPELRACAALALGRIGTDQATAALRRAAADKEILVRNAVNRALRGVPA
ncbi:MAG TPA: HEAT repeat domain-containing protein [Gemmatimonadaceae bacterium]|nr:HEAT repeat domain-containing protein [Gemmatimonadaceae bacterium]